MDTQPDTRRCPLWVKIALALSLAFNLAIVGLAAGFVLRGGPMGARGPAMGYATPYVLALPRELRREVFGAVRNDKNLPNRRSRGAPNNDTHVPPPIKPFVAPPGEAGC